MRSVGLPLDSALAVCVHPTYFDLLTPLDSPSDTLATHTLATRYSDASATLVISARIKCRLFQMRCILPFDIQYDIWWQQFSMIFVRIKLPIPSFVQFKQY